MRIKYVVRKLEDMKNIPESATILTIKIPMKILPTVPKNITELRCSNIGLRSIKHFSANLKYIDCSNNNITYLPELPKGLQVFKCYKNPINFLPKIPNRLIILNCSFTKIKCISPLPLTLEELICNNCELTTFPYIPGPTSVVIANNNTFCNIITVLIDKDSNFCTDYLGFDFKRVENVNILYYKINKFLSQNMKNKNCKEIKELRDLEIKENGMYSYD